MYMKRMILSMVFANSCEIEGSSGTHDITLVEEREENSEWFARNFSKVETTSSCQNMLIPHISFSPYFLIE